MFHGGDDDELMSLQALQSLNLSKNRLTGRIPENIGDLKSLISFDVSLNRLSGELPVSLSSLSFLSCFNVSYNNLTGRVPSSTQLKSFNESSLWKLLTSPPIGVAMPPMNLFSKRSMIFKLFEFMSNSPKSLLLHMSNDPNMDNFAKDLGISPVRLLLWKFKIFKDSQVAKQSGRTPERFVLS